MTENSLNRLAVIYISKIEIISKSENIKDFTKK